MLTLNIVLLLSILFLNISSADKYIFIKHFYELYGGVRNIIIFDCESDHVFSSALKYFSKHRFHVKFHHASRNFNIDSLLRKDSSKLGITVNMKCDNSSHFLRTASEYDYPAFNYTNKWLLLNGELTDSTVNFLSNLSIRIDAEFRYVEMEKEGGIFKMNDVYKTNGLIVRHIGDWTEDGGFSIVAQKYKYVERKNLTGVVMRSAIVVRTKMKGKFLDFLTSAKDTHLDSMNRFNYALLLHLRDMYNFRYRMSRTLSWGYLHNGTFDGMIGQLSRNEIDIGGSPLYLKKERLKVTDYTAETWIPRICFVFRHPRKTSLLKIYIRPFNVKVWCCAIGILVLITFIVSILNSVQHEIKPSRKLSPGEILLFIFGAVFQQGVFIDSILISGRIVIFTVFIFSVLFYQFYSGSIVSSLLSKTPITIKTLKNLLDSDLNVGIVDIPYNVDYFKRTTDPVALELYRRKISNDYVHNLFTSEIGLEMVKNQKFALHVDTALAYKTIVDTFSEQEICELSEVNMFQKQGLINLVPKRSPYRKMITYGFRKMSETGLMSRQRRIWHARKPKCSNTVSKSSVNITEFSSALMFLLFGMLLSVSILIVELKYSKDSVTKKRSRNRKRRFCK